MLNVIFAVICLISFIFALFLGRLDMLAAAVVGGAAKAVTLTISLVGLTGLWCGVMNVFSKCGLCQAVAKLISPFLKIVFPESFKKKIGINEIAANISANLLGLGNAATPFGIKAMQALSAQSDGITATDDMVTFAVLNTSSVSLMPTTLIALRSSCGSSAPFEIITAVWICSFICMCVSVIITKLLGFIYRTGRRKKCNTPLPP